MDNDKVLTRVRELLAYAEDPNVTPESAATYTAKASELMAKYGIDAARLAAAKPESDPLDNRKFTTHAPYALDKSLLLGSVAVAMRCKAINITRRGNRSQRVMHLFGYTSDLDRAEILYTSLLVQMNNALAKSPGPRPGESASAYKRSFFAGFIHKVYERLKDAETRAARDADAAPSGEASPAAPSGGPSVALVLANRSKAVEQETRRVYPRLKSSSRRSLSGSGVSEGRAAGARADLGGTRLSRGRNRAIEG